MVRVPSDRPHVPQITPKEIKADTGDKAQQAAQAGKQIPNIGKGPEYDSSAVATRAKAVAGMLAALAVEAEEKELSFLDIIGRVMKLTGIDNPEAAMEEASRKLQKEIDAELEAIKSNKELMEEAESWQTFADLLESKLSTGQVSEFIGLLEAEIRGKDVKD